MELGIPQYLINATLLGVLAQRLVRTLCKNCKVRDLMKKPARNWRS
jgi:general secretion pathway protein E